MVGKPQIMPTKAALRAVLAKHTVSGAAKILGCHRASIRRWGLKYGLLDRDRPYSYESIPTGDQLRKLCVRFTDEQLADRFGCSPVTIKARRYQLGLHRSRVRRRYTLDETFFERIDTEHKAYFLGLLASDGTVSTRSVWLMLQARDVHILRDLRAAMGSNARIFERKIDPKFPNRGPYKFIYFGSHKLVADLTKLGITARKSLTLKYPKVPKHLERHFIRGLLDGDGSVKQASFCFHGTESIVDGIQLAVFSRTGKRLHKAHQQNKLWRLTGCKGSKEVLSWLYDGASVFLRRKRRAFLRYWR